MASRTNKNGSNKFQGKILTLSKNHWKLDSSAMSKFLKRRFLGNISNSCHWATHMGLKPTQKKFFEKISKNTADRGVQNFGLIEGAAELLL